MKRYHFVVPDEMWASLTQAARIEETTVAEQVRGAIRLWLRVRSGAVQVNDR